jgi:hypothetical protein
MSSRLTKLAATGTVAVAAALGGSAWAIAGGGDDNGSATGPGADRAKAAAVAHLGGGTANAVERDSEKGATWEVEVAKAGGGTADVRLDAAYKVVAVESDSESADDPNGHADEQDGVDEPGAVDEQDGGHEDPAGADHQFEGQE